MPFWAESRAAAQQKYLLMRQPHFITEERLFMEIRQGYSYHIKDEFFDLVQGDSG